MKFLIGFLLLTLPLQTALAQAEKLDIDGAIRISHSESDNPTPTRSVGPVRTLKAGMVSSGPSLTGGKQVGVVADIEGNTYNTIVIGAQVWMAENLTTSHYNDSIVIDQLTDNGLWKGATAGAWCHYDNGASHDQTYGKIYNQYTIFTGKLCPTGWHVPSADEWQTLFSYLGGTQKAGGPMKVQGTEFWQAPNTGAKNTSGFSELPGGSAGMTVHLMASIRMAVGGIRPDMLRSRMLAMGAPL